MSQKKRPQKPSFLEQLLNPHPESILDVLLPPAPHAAGKRPFEVICHFCGTQFPVDGLCPGCGTTGEETAERT